MYKSDNMIYSGKMEIPKKHDCDRDKDVVDCKIDNTKELFNREIKSSIRSVKIKKNGGPSFIGNFTPYDNPLLKK